MMQSSAKAAAFARSLTVLCSIAEDPSMNEEARSKACTALREALGEVNPPLPEGLAERIERLVGTDRHGGPSFAR